MAQVANPAVARPRLRQAPRRGTAAWPLQQVTSYGLAIFLPVHLAFTYFGVLSSPGPLTADQLHRPFELLAVLFAINEFGLLICGLYHGLNGVRNILYDLVTSPAIRRVLTLLLIVGGLWFLYDGGLTLWALAAPNPYIIP